MSSYVTMRRLWQRIPEPIRRRIRAFPPLNWLRRGMRDALLRITPHGDIYDANFFKENDERTMFSAEVIAESIISHFGPSTVMDVGCGSGVLLHFLNSHSVQVEGIEYSDAALSMCRSRGLRVQKFNLEEDVGVDTRKFDLVVSTEVAEHLPESCASRYVDLLCRISDTVLFTAATPGQGGIDHINEQPHEYWIDKFNARGFEYDGVLSSKLRSTWKEKGTLWWYHNNAMVFSKGKRR